MLRAVIFDMDGALVDSESRHYPILRDLLAEYGYRYTLETFDSIVVYQSRKCGLNCCMPQGFVPARKNCFKNIGSVTGRISMPMDCLHSLGLPGF